PAPVRFRYGTGRHLGETPQPDLPSPVAGGTDERQSLPVGRQGQPELIEGNQGMAGRRIDGGGKGPPGGGRPGNGATAPHARGERQKTRHSPRQLLADLAARGDGSRDSRLR